VEKSARELVKLAKEAKPITDAVKKAKEKKEVANPQKKWDEYLDELIKTSEHLGKVAGKTNATFQDAKDAFGAVKKVCTDCHKDFRVDESTF
jgi:cytochrome c556